MLVIVRLANGDVEVGDLEVERSTTQDDRRERVHGVDVLGAEEGRMMWVDDWFVIEVDVAVDEREGRWSSDGVEFGLLDGGGLRCVPSVELVISGCDCCSPSSAASFAGVMFALGVFA
jgi:hypothetical protein